MASTNVEKFAAFAHRIATSPPPPEVLEETKRIVLDALGCGLAATTSEFGRVGVEYGRILGSNGDEATIIGHRERSSLHGAAFANTELISALDLTAINLPGHVVPYIVPVTLALGEARHQSGSRLLSATAVCLEMCFRLSKSMDDLRDVQGRQAGDTEGLRIRQHGVRARRGRHDDEGPDGGHDGRGARHRGRHFAGQRPAALADAHPEHDDQVRPRPGTRPRG